MKAIVAGAGIGGLTAALALHRIGWQVQVCEAVAELRPLGVGINLLPHGSAVLHDLGLGLRLARLGIRTRAVEYRTRFGHLIAADPRGVEAGFAQPQYSIHRGALQFMLAEAAMERLGPQAIRTGLRLTGFDADGAGVTARFAAAGGGADTSLQGDILVGADGFHSAVRAQLYPDEGAAHYEGVMMWRGAHEQAPFGDGRTMVIAGNHDVKFVCYPISEEARRRDRALLNWVAELRHDAPRPLHPGDWTRRGARDFIARFTGFGIDFLDIVALMEATEEIFEFPMIDRDPLARWSFGRVTLLGDAAHPMYPIGANGASQAILDAAALAQALAERPGDPAAALAAYQDARLAPANGVVLANRQSGPEKVLDIADARLTGPQDRIEDLISPAEVEAVASGYRAVAGFRRTGES
ncbi:MAG: FAD-dependent monooxygenase [Sneathiellaceae bacterium]